MPCGCLSCRTWKDETGFLYNLRPWAICCVWTTATKIPASSCAMASRSSQIDKVFEVKCRGIHDVAKEEPTEEGPGPASRLIRELVGYMAFRQLHSMVTEEELAALHRAACIPCPGIGFATRRALEVISPVLRAVEGKQQVFVGIGIEDNGGGHSST